MSDKHLISEQFLLGGGQMAADILDKDWGVTPLGPIETWPQSLRTTVSLCLASNFPISIAWGPQRNQIYNDGYRPICGAKHPSSMGQDFKECWFSAWPVIGKAFERAEAGDTSFLENQRMFLDRNGYLEEAFFTFSFSPIRDETGKIGGIFHPVTETTALMLSERRTHSLRDLAARTAKCHCVEDVYAEAFEALRTYALDLPFAFLYVFPDSGVLARLVGTMEDKQDLASVPAELDWTASDNVWPMQQVIDSGETCVVESLDFAWESRNNPYPEAPTKALALPIRIPGKTGVAGALIAGVSSRLPLDEAYRNFFELLAGHLGTAMANALAYQDERRRAEALAELDRTKTTFFSNVSHEFRTPLTLMLGPLEDLLARPGESIPVEREELGVVHRNAERLLRLVNSLLDFSRIEAGRAQACYEPVDLAEITNGLAGVFRSAIEKAGLQLIVECPRLPSEVYVDRDMWEKIVLNLISNAFKFTLEGEIRVCLASGANRVELSVTDTGTGISSEEMPRVFERFHRVENARSRTYEGTGIGLSLLHELVKLHGGSVQVQSELGKGSVFRVYLPFGSSHLPAEQVAKTANQTNSATAANSFVAEALRWLPQENTNPSVAPEAKEVQPLCKQLVLLADDNADMRDYVHRLLKPHYEVVAVTNGRDALESALQRLPDLIVSDVMMPELDGFGLVAELRKSKATEHIPVILLSARAGEEAKVEGLEAGADDYIIKPFSAKELLARVRTNLELAQLRRKVSRASQTRFRDTEYRLNLAVTAGHLGTWEYDPISRILTSDAHCKAMFGFTEDAEFTMEIAYQALHPDDVLHTQAAIEAALDSNGPGAYLVEYRTLGHADNSLRYVQAQGQTIFGIVDDERAAIRLIGTVQDITARKQSEDLLFRNAETFFHLIDQAPFGIFVVDGQFRLHQVNSGAKPAFRNVQPLIGCDLAEAIHIIWPEPIANDLIAIYRHTLESGESYFAPSLTEQRSDIDVVESYEWQIHRIMLPDGEYGVVCYFFDSTKLRETEMALRESERHYADMVANLPGMIYRARRGVEGITEFLQVSEGCRALFGLDPEVFKTDPLLLRRLVHPEDMADYSRAAMLAFEQQAWNWQGRIVLPSGQVKTIMGRGRPSRQANGELLWNGMLMDVTERVEAEQNASQLAAIVESSSDAIKSENLDGIITSWNQAAVQMYGYTEQEMLGQTVARLLPPDRIGESDDLLERILRGEAVQSYETVRQAKDGALLDIALTASPIKDHLGKVTGISFTDQDIRQRKEAEAHIQRSLLRIQALRNIDMAISASLDLRVTLNVLLDQVTTHLHVDSADVLLLNPYTHRLEYAASRGFRSNAIQRTQLRLGEDFAGRAAFERRVLNVPNLAQNKSDFVRAALLAGEGFVSYWVAPLITKGRVEGVLEIFHRSPQQNDLDWRNFLEALAGQAAIAIENAALFNDLQRSNVDLQIAYDSTLEGWSKALDLRDKETEGHTLRVTEGTMTLARAMNIAEDEMLQMRRGALLHDIGKMGIPDNVLLKPGGLTSDEWIVMRKHPVYAYEMLSPIQFLRPALDIPYGHHEKWDGSGYPRGLKGEQIPLSARIFAVVDVWDALRSDRPYRKGWSVAKVRDHIAKGSGSHFDPHVVEMFLDTKL